MHRDQRSTAPYGSWVSPLTAARVTAGALRLRDIVLDGDDVYWVEGRASEGGRNVVVRRSPDGCIADVTPPGFNVRSRVHEYGGGAYTVHQGTIYFANFADQRLYAQAPGASPVALTAPGYFYGDLHVDAHRHRLLAIREDHTQPRAEPVNVIAEIELGNPEGLPPQSVLASGADFYAHPVLSPDGSQLAWIEWRHPNMPWDGTELWTATLDESGAAGRRVRIAGGSDESIFQPEWSPGGVLHFVSDRTGWWNLYRHDERGLEAVHPMAAEFGKPLWTLSMVTYTFVPAAPGAARDSVDRIAATYTVDGRWKLAFITGHPPAFEPVPLPVDPLESIVAHPLAIYFIGASPTTPAAVIRMPFATREPEVLRRSAAETIDPEWISVGEPVTFTAPVREDAYRSAPDRTRAQVSAPRDVHAFYFPPRNPDHVAPAGTGPPLLVLSHGGPTGATDGLFDPAIQFWTSRGFAVLDVNYSGSTGYGRAYRDRLQGQWGVVDVEDVVAGALGMVAAGRADARRLAIRGGSAGGYTTLAALTFHSVFAAGASYYGISDIEVLARDTHKFESRYLDSLIGPYPEQRDLYVARSPIHATDRLSSALILFQGLEDKVVPPNQSQMMADAVARKGLPVAYLAFEGEQHGFRKADNIVRSLEAELAFYGQVFGIHIADRIEPPPRWTAKGEVRRER